MALDTEVSTNWSPRARGAHVSKLSVPAVKAGPAKELDEKIKAHVAKHEVAYEVAFRSVLDDPDNLELRQAYAGGKY